jgi:hypothetical protein
MTEPFTSWSPPDPPDPGAIFDELRQDTKAGRYADALAKHLWFHENALQYEPGLYGVRLSYAISEWRDLGQHYPPALDDLKAAREKAEAACRTDPDVRERFHDFVSINGVLGEEDVTVGLFMWLDANRPEVAQEVHDVARPALIRAGKHELAGKYVQPEPWAERIVEMYRVNRQFEKEFGPDHKDFTENKFTNDAATLVAILVVTGRGSEAGPVAEKLRGEWDDPGFHDAIREALAGVVPAPWPPPC